ncbi:MAG: helix-turn-helix transcriptional regulator [Ginsengibacter sp.]
MVPPRKDFYKDSLSYYAKKLHAPIVDNIVNVPTHLGSGFIKGFFLEEGLYIKYFNLSLKQDIEYELFHDNESPDVYKLIFPLENDYRSSEIESIQKAFLFSSEFERTLTARRENYICGLALDIDISWLRTNHSKANSQIYKLINTLLNTNNPACISAAMDSKSFLLIRQILAGLSHDLFIPLQIKTRIFLLLNDFINKISGDIKVDVLYGKSLHTDTMIEVEKKLNYLIVSNHNPRTIKIADLADEFNMSISTFRRHFKIVFGKNIYEHYQEKRMLWAKVQLESGNRNVTEVARYLGFLKTNNFSKAFYKEFGILPKEAIHKLLFVITLFQS